MSSKEHWEDIYKTKTAREVSWYRPHLDISLDLIRETGVGPEGRIIDIGGGASTLVDDLLAAGHRHITVLDIALSALEDAKSRLKEKAEDVTWLVGDVTEVDLPAAFYDLWHDRAVFHFLTERADRESYVAAAVRAVKPGGNLVVGTFGPEGPSKCSGLDVVRYSVPRLAAVLRPRFTLMKAVQEDHTTPTGRTQQFIYGLFRKTG